MKIKKCVFVVFFSLYLPLMVSAESGTQTVNDLASLLAMDLESLGSVQVQTVSRRSTDIKESPAVVSVVTAEDIARRGYRSLHDVMQNIPGVNYNVSSQFENLTSRGISQTLTSFLLLIDGHAVNNRSAFGISVETVFPTLSNVARIEVIRGAGSVLWGTEAGMGVINVITKSGRSMDETGEGRLELSVDYETKHNREIASAVYGKRFEDGELMASFTTFDSDAPHGQAFRARANGPVPIQRFNANSDFRPSFDLYFKGGWKNVGFKAQVSRFLNQNFDNTQLNNAQQDRNWLELTWSPRLSDSTRLENRIYYNNHQLAYEKTVTNFDKKYTMQGGGAEAIIFYERDEYSLTSGVITEVHKLEFLTSNQNTSGELFEAAPTTTDTQVALFGEGTYRGIKDWQFTLGGRVQHNRGILDKTMFLPRAAAIYSINDNWTAKYVYNASEVAPHLNLWLGGRQGQLQAQTNPRAVAGANKSQKYDIHDLQLNYSDEMTSVTASLFYIQVKDMIQFLAQQGVTLPDGSIGVQRWINGPGANSKGVQLEFNHQRQGARFYGDYTYTDSEFDKRSINFQGNTVDLVVDRALANESLRLTTTPRHIWNLGTNIDLRDNLSLNLHYRGYADMLTKWTSPTPSFRNLGTEHFFDVTLLWRNVATKNLDLTFYARNITNNNAVVADNVTGGFVKSVFTRRIGATLRYSF